MKIGKQLQNARSKIGITRAELSRRTKIHPAKLRDLEFGAQVRGLEEMLPLLSKELKVPLAFFFGVSQSSSTVIETEIARIQTSASKILDVVV